MKDTKITVRVSEDIKREFFSRLSLNGEKAQHVLSKCVAGYIGVCPYCWKKKCVCEKS